MLFYTSKQLQSLLLKKQGNLAMQKVASRIFEGSLSFFQEECKYLFITALPVIVLIFYWNGIISAFAFFVGIAVSSISGWLSLYTATKANIRTAEAARIDLNSAFKISLSSGSIVGSFIMGMALLVILLFFEIVGTGEKKHFISLALGCEWVALFLRLGGGIYTKAVDIGADMVGKIEKSLPEDDPRNPAIIADNVGDNVGDIAGMGADIFSSCITTMVTIIIFWNEIQSILLFSTIIGIGGIIFLILHVLPSSKVENKKEVSNTLHRKTLLAIILNFFVATFYLFFSKQYNIYSEVIPYIACLTIGLALVYTIEHITFLYTASGKRGVDEIIAQTITGTATNIISGLAMGMESVALSGFSIIIAIALSYHILGIQGLVFVNLGIMMMVPLQLAMDSLGPIADNAGGIAKVSLLEKEVRSRTDILDTVGNTTAAMGKGFAIASATLTTLVAFSSFVHIIKAQQQLSLTSLHIISLLLLGGIVPFLFSSMVIRAVGRVAQKVVIEARRQLQENPSIMEGKIMPDYNSCITIATRAALFQMCLPTFLTLIVPIIISYFFSYYSLAAYVVGVALSSIPLGIFQCNAGGAWDNTKKAFEKGIVYKGSHFQEGSDSHKASIIGDTVGDALKDASGPSMNILMKLTIVLALIIVTSN